MHTRLIPWTLAVLLVLCQSALLLHQSDLNAHSEGGICSICLLAHGIDTALPTLPFLPNARPETPTLAHDTPRAGYCHVAIQAYDSRAPPVNDLLS